LKSGRIQWNWPKKFYQITGSFPSSEQFGLMSQMRRAAVSISSNLAEGVARSGRQYKADFIKFLVYSQASCDETITHLNFIKDAHKEKAAEVSELIAAYEELGKKINRFITYVQTNWKSTRNPSPQQGF
jgi:four helix bundle protein